MNSQTRLFVDSNNYHQVTSNDRNLVLHVPSGALFETSPLSADLFDFIKNRSSFNLDELPEDLTSKYQQEELNDSIEEFKTLSIINEHEDRQKNKPVEIENFPLNTLVLNVNTGCNLSCTYCYKEDLDTPSNGKKMTFDTAKDSIDMLIKESGGNQDLNVVFFGGEPLSNIKLIKEVVSYTDEQCQELGLKVDYSLTTNATLLTDPIIEYLAAHRIGVSISMDGPQAVHDRNRITVGGQGTYHVVVEKSRKLLDAYKTRPIGARVTLTKGYTNVVAIHEHLKGELGFSEVGYAPVTAGAVAHYDLSNEELIEVFESMKQLGNIYLENALQNKNIGFSNMHQLMKDIYEGRKKSVPCGAGVGLLAIDHKGDINLCHRFTGSELPTFGDVKQGIEKKMLSEFISAASDLEGKGCETCHIRSFCAGGCYHESYAHFGDPLSPTYNYCELMRDWIDFGIKVYIELLEKNPDFIKKYIATRGR